MKNEVFVPLGDERSHGAGCLRLLNQISDWSERTELCVNTNKLLSLLLCMNALERDWDNLSRAQSLLITSHGYLDQTCNTEVIL
jgi:hypothetical protein